MLVRAKIMAFDGLRRVRIGQVCEVDDKLIKRDENGKIIRPKWAIDINEELPPPATTPYPKKLPERTQSVFSAPQTPVQQVEPVSPRRGRPPKVNSSDNVI